MTRKNFCLYPFTAFSIDNAGKTRICCNNDAWDRVFLNKSISEPDFDLETEYNNPLHKEVRQFMIEDRRHPSCKKCWEIEDQGQVSWRQWFNRSFQTDNELDDWLAKCEPDGTIKNLEFLYLEITFGNRCNLKCVMCNGYNSTLFLKEEFETKQIDETTYKRLIKLDWFDDTAVFEKLYGFIANVQRIHIVGGEPLIIEHQDFLKKLIELDVAKNIIISYNSNLTKLPREILECWKKFKRVYLCVSVDAYAELNEFIRFPMKWDKLIANLHTVDQIAKDQDNITIQIHSTFSSLNIQNFVQYLDWIKDITAQYTSIECHPMFNYVYNPTWADPINLPAHIKNQCYKDYVEWEEKNQIFLNSFFGDTQRFDMLRSYFEKINATPGNSVLFEEFLERIKFYEQVRNIQFPKL
jgi:MoaA/NifB/PqqE/SkfB family radical SAM enzyme